MAAHRRQIISVDPDGNVILITFFIVLNTSAKQHLVFSSAVISIFMKNVAHQVSNINQALVVRHIFLKQRSN